MELCCAMAELDTNKWWVRATVQSGCGEFGCGVLQYNFDGGWWCHNIFDIKRRFVCISKHCVHGGIRRMLWGNGWPVGPRAGSLEVLRMAWQMGFGLACVFEPCYSVYV